MHLRHCSVLLCTSTKPFTINSMLILVVPYPEKIPEGFNAENYGWVKKTMIKVH